MNPPYQDPKNKRYPLYQRFIKKAFEICREEGYIAAVHPCAWRKPEHKLFKLFQDNNLKYLEIHNIKDGINNFKVSTRYDWYILKKSLNTGKTLIIDEDKKEGEYDISKLYGIPHFNIDFYNSLIAVENTFTCKILYSYTVNEARKEWMSREKKGKFKYPCVGNTSVKGINLWYSKIHISDSFSVPKIIMGTANPSGGFYDEKGIYGMTSHSFAIEVENKKEAKIILKVIKTNKFKKLLKSTKWSGFQTEYRMFKYFKKDFWKEFI